MENILKTDRVKKSLEAELLKSSKKHAMELLELTMKQETERLEEMGELSQKLHDKVGHSMSGSVFKLEAAKLLLNTFLQKVKKTDEKTELENNSDLDKSREMAKSEVKSIEKSQEIIEEVIVVLRESIEEIRQLLRREKPEPEELGVKKLEMLLLEFNKNYEIKTSFKYEGDIGRLSVGHWSVIHQNTIEALTNVLRYSNCDEVEARIYVYNKMARFNFRDNGRGTKLLEKGMGISGMEERLNLLGGSLTISTERGFELNMLMPI